MFEIRLLGTPEFSLSGVPFAFRAPPRALPLLAWLLLNRRAPHARDAVAFAFWPDAAEDEARGDLRRHLYYVTKALPPAPGGEPWIVADKKIVAWNERAPYRLDVAEFERACADGAALDAAVALYRGPLLDGLADEWIEPERERVQQLAETALQTLVERNRVGDPARALAYAQQLLRVDPWREDALRNLVSLRHALGDRAGAMREYRDFAARLRAELDVAPMPETTAVFEAIAHGEPPPHAALTAVPADASPAAEPGARTNLPARSAPLLGRARALDDVRELLAVTRIATLVGTGGVGKTRLSIDVALESLDAFPGGVWFADLAPLAEPGLAIAAIAAAVGIARATERPDVATVVAALRRKRALLVLDNCEHVVGEVAHAAGEIVAGAPDVRILATSREPLGVRGERVYRVPSLDVPPAFVRQTPESARAFGSVALFEARALAADPSFRLDASNVAHVVEICRRLDGIALALELAASRVTVLAPRELAERLEERFRLLAGGERTALPRQRTMRATIDWSWDLCTPDERVLLARLGVFAAGCTLAAAEAVCFEPPLDPASSLDLIGALARKSLAIAETGSVPVRYRLLESIRHYVLEKLSASDERAATLRRHAAYFAAFAQRVEAAYETRPDPAWYAAATAELDDVRGALAWCFGDGGDALLGATLASAFGRVWEYGANRADRRWLDTAYERLDRAAHPELTARLVWQIASISHADERHVAWVAVALRDRADACTRAEGLVWVAEQSARLGRHADAREALHEAAARQDPLVRPKAQAAYLRVRGACEAAANDLEAASASFERAIAAGNACGAIATVAATRVALAEAAFLGGNTARAIDVARYARATICDAFGATIAYAEATGNLAMYELVAGRLEDAREHAREALEIARDLEFSAHVATFAETLAAIAARAGDFERAAFVAGFTEAERIRRDRARGAKERDGYERLLELVREALGADGARLHLARGAIAGSERVVAEALGATT